MATVNEKLLDKYIRHAIYLERFKNSEARKISSLIGKDVLPALKAKIETVMAKKMSPKRLKQLSAALESIMKVGMIKAGKSTIKSLQDLSLYEAEWNVNTVKKTVPLDVDMTMPSAEVLRQLVTTKVMEGHKLETWLSSWSMAAKKKMMKEIKIGVVLGESLPAIGRRMRSVMTLKRKQAEYIARTAVSAVVHNAKQEVYKANKELIKKYQWVATLDTRTTLTCINLDGQVFLVAQGPIPPAHFNCRSTTIPIITAWNELGIEPPPPGTRASMNGAVPDKITYKDWFKKQTAKTKEDILGKNRYKMYRGGKSLRSFVNNDYEPITLKRLKFMEAKNA